MSISSNERIQRLVEEAETELTKIQPEIEYLEQCYKKLTELKHQQFKLNSLILSLKSIIKLSDENTKTNKTNSNYKNEILNINTYSVVESSDINVATSRDIFLPDQAISQVKNYLRTKNNLNYEIFKAVVFNSGIASTEQIKQYLIENNIRQPKTGKTFENIELKEISSRANYLVRKQILTSIEPGTFKSVFGWNKIS